MMLFLGKKLDQDQAWPIRRTMREHGIVEVSYSWAPKAGGQEYGVTTTFDFRGLDYLTMVDLACGSGLVVRTQGKLRSAVNSTKLEEAEKAKVLTMFINNGPAKAIKVAEVFKWTDSEEDPFDKAVHAMTSNGVPLAVATKAVESTGMKRLARSEANPIVVAAAETAAEKKGKAA